MINKIAIYGTLILCTLLLVTCTTDEESMIGPFGDASKYIYATKLSVEHDVIYVDGDSTTVTIVLLDSEKTPLEGLKVLFSTDLGEITESDITDTSGTAEAVFVSSEDTGEATITVNTGAKIFEINLTVIKYQPTTIELSAESLVLLADGNDYTKITATPRDAEGNMMPNIAIQISTDLGTLSSSPDAVTTNTELTTNSGSAGNGAVVYLWSSTTIGTAEVTATAGISSNMNIYFYLEVPEYIFLSADPMVLRADGSSSTTITATVLDEDGLAMKDRTVSFETTAGQLVPPPIAITDENGKAAAVLISSTEEEIATVTAKSYISSTIDVQFTLNIPFQIVISALPTRVIADGSTVSTITAIPKDDNGNPMAGIDVSFSTTLGNLSKSYDETDDSGVSEVELTSTIDGVATVTADVSSVEATANVTFYEYNPAYIVIDSEESSILADGFSKTKISAIVYDYDGNVIPWAIVDFSTNYGHLSDTTEVVADQTGKAEAVLTSRGSLYDLDVRVTATARGTNVSKTVPVVFRGINLSFSKSPDSTTFVKGGFYNVFVSATLRETSNGEPVSGAAVEFVSTIGDMEPDISTVNEFGIARSVMKAEVSGSPQYNLVITAQLPNASDINKQTNSLEIPGVETQVYTINDEIMGDGKSFALAKATLQETTGKAIPNITIQWESTFGTIVSESLTDSLGSSIVTYTIEDPVSSNTNATIRTSFGENVFDTETVTIVLPATDNRLSLGFEPDTTGHGFIPCDIDTSIATRDIGITALYVDGNSNPIDSETIAFSLSPNGIASICATANTVGTENGRASVMMSYPPQMAGQIVRVWAEAQDGTGARGNIDVILPKDETSGGG